MSTQVAWNQANGLPKHACCRSEIIPSLHIASLTNVVFKPDLPSTSCSSCSVFLLQRQAKEKTSDRMNRMSGCETEEDRPSLSPAILFIPFILSSLPASTPSRRED